MQIVFFTHPKFFNIQSIPRFVRMLADGMRKRGYAVETIAPEPLFLNLPLPGSLKKWLGYIDQYLLFPGQVRKRLKTYPPDTLFVFTDQALGPWVPLVANRPHVIHCHDFLAQLSAIGEFRENPVSWTGKKYQAFIKRGYSRGKNFISVSEKTRQDLHHFLPSIPGISKIVYNGMNQSFKPEDSTQVRAVLSGKLKIDLNSGYILHVGGNQWYKNRLGVIEIYNEWRANCNINLPLLLIGEPPSSRLSNKVEASSYRTNIHILTGIGDETLQLAYAGAAVFVFPSLAEGFGWPIAEAMACGCPVITTNEPPMTEVGGKAAFYISKRPLKPERVKPWAVEGGELISKIMRFTDLQRKAVAEAGLNNIKRFDSKTTLDQIEIIYRDVLQY